MNIKEISGKMGGILELDLYRNKEDQKKGIVQQHIKIHNKMTNVSLAVISGLLFNTGSQLAFSYGALGTSAIAVSAAHTALQAEITTIGLQRVTGTPSQSTTAQTNDTGVLTFTWTSSGSTTIQEFGILNNTLVSGISVMLARVLTTSIPVVSGNVVTGTYSWQAVGN